MEEYKRLGIGLVDDDNDDDDNTIIFLKFEFKFQFMKKNYSVIIAVIIL